MTEFQGPGWAPKKPPPSGDGEPAPKPRRFWWRFLLASVLILAVSAGTTATAALLYIDDIANKIAPKNDKIKKKLERVLTEAEEGGARNFLLVGSDKRAGAEFAEDKGRSDTVMLVRLDPDKDLISMMSIPRDLKVEIPGFTGKFNEAYFYGGTELTAEVVKELTGLPIHHIVNIDFLGFAQGVYAIGCVYTDVDRRYYHSNEGVPPSEQYAEINVQPGYQLMCGKKALDYVRYRHTDTDIVRSARQQDFLGAIRHRIDVKDIVFDQAEDLVEAFTKYTTSDISDGGTLLEVLKLAAASRNSTINEVEFPAELSPTYVYASKEAIEGAVQEFLGNAGAGTTAATKKVRADGKKKAGAKKDRKKQKRKKPQVETPKPGNDGLVLAREAGEAEAKIASRRARGHFPIYYPTRLPEGTFFVESNPYEKIIDPYVYNLKDDDGDRHLAYRMVLVGEMSDGTHYFGIQGIRGWSDPPITDDPSLTKEINGRDYDIFLDGDRVKMVAWRRGENVYWISNDLLRTLTNDQMIGMARSANVFIPKKKPKRGRSRG